jgi:peptide-methionine (S)-S-oxide reductase
MNFAVMKIQFLLFLVFSGLLTTLMACNPSASKQASQSSLSVNDTTNYGPLDTATFAMGCFWCVEAIFENLKGVKEAESGYSGGYKDNPTYEEVGVNQTGHAETVQIYYDPKIISYQTLLDVYFACGDPTQEGGQGPDRGTPYRSVIFYRTEQERSLAEATKAALDQSGKYANPIQVMIQPLKKFWIAEAYHQNYERLHPENPYVQSVSIPRLKRTLKLFPDLVKK